MTRSRRHQEPKARGRNDLRFESLPLSGLEPRATNPRTHSKKQIRRIAKSIERFGFNNPILIDGEGGIVAGHGRVEAAKLLGRETVPVLRVTDLTPEQIRAYRLADNRLAELAGWDEQILAIEFEALQALELDVDLAVTGFAAPHIDLLIQSLSPGDDGADEPPTVDEDMPRVSRRGENDWPQYRHRCPSRANSAALVSGGA